jgi:hypothetical protein
MEWNVVELSVLRKKENYQNKWEKKYNKGKKKFTLRNQTLEQNCFLGGGNVLLINLLQSHKYVNLYRVIKKSLFTWHCILIIRCTDNFLSSCIFHTLRSSILIVTAKTRVWIHSSPCRISARKELPLRLASALVLLCPAVAWFRQCFIFVSIHLIM